MAPTSVPQQPVREPATGVWGSPHPGERVVQERAGRAFHGRIRNAVPEIAAAFLSTQPMIVISGRGADRRLWVTMLTGAPGFLEVPEPRTVSVRALPQPGDPLAALVAHGGEVGMVAIDSRHRMRVNGTLEPASGDGFVVHTEQVYSNCTKHISERYPLGSEPPADGATAVLGSQLDPAQIAMVRAADTFFVGSSHPDGPTDASHRGGNPGFVLVDGPDRLRWPDYIGNSMFNTLGNLVLNPEAALLFPDWSSGGLLQVSGRAVVDWDPAAAAPLAGAERVVELTVEAVRYAPRATGLRWGAPILSRFNY
jgi:predicted pyridoxine 5'-phosphate oxidase superfamily flavin-nucleotide-binding protein